ncbi:hypothetical protein CYJ29_05235 [Aerococcus loyolae]|uniref:Uncharacterized protein n=1 Tax=Aerococcus urinae TaxID=1376 RepID=A0A2I1L6Q8_9LACT|nr:MULTISPECIES: hypothetical protein [Aerococcus]MCY3067837.1 hypothetical protein [Aerococcus mictus]MCY3080650.1 hypothetical protein [Aerococcus mictus]MDK6727936.1 hypothetical protein [Aerococcus urinae]MDK7910217.1 hypothetical protein [Aerococcus urinae]MDK8610047.1 hypothetical protein [Aerococcus urinae]
MRKKARPLELKVERILNKNSSTFSEEDACLAPEAGLNRVRLVRKKARPLELKVERILNKNSSTFSEEDACLAPEAGLNRESDKRIEEQDRWRKKA